MSIIAKNSAGRITNKPAAFKNERIRNNTEWTGFLVEITINEEIKITPENK